MIIIPTLPLITYEQFTSKNYRNAIQLNIENPPCSLLFVY